MMGTAVGLALLGFLAIIVEFFVPAAGIIGVIGLGCVVTGIVLTFLHSGTIAGIIFLVACLIIGPVIMFFYFKLFPQSFIGRRLILNTKGGGGSPPGHQETDKAALAGAEGISLTDLRPSGMALIGNRKLSVVTQGEYIEPQVKIRVTRVEGSRIVVKKNQKGE